MANGQVLYEAPKSNLGGLAQLYMAGQAEIRKVRSEVRASRAAEMESLGKTISDLQLTGLQDLDKMYNSSGNLLRARISQAHADNQNGFISRADATRITNQAIAEANMIVNSAEIVGQNYETLKEAVENGDKSRAELAKFESSYFGFHRNMDPKLKRTTLLTDGPTGLTFQHTYQYYDANGDVQTATKNSPLHNSVNPAEGNISGFNTIDWTKDITTAIGNIAQPNYMGSTPMNNTQIGTWVRNNADDPRVKETIEKLIDGYNDNDLIGVLYDELTVRARWDGEYTGEKNQADIDTLVKNRYIDKKGDVITFGAVANGNHLFSLDSDIEGNYKITDEQKKLAQSYLRMTAYTALGVSYKNYKDTSSGSSGTTDFDQPFSAFPTKPGGNSTNIFNYWAALSNREQLYIQETGQGALPSMSNLNLAAYNQAIQSQDSGFLKAGDNGPNHWNQGWKNMMAHVTGIETGTWNTVVQNGFEANMFQNGAQNETALFIGETGLKKSGFKLKSLGGKKFETIKQIGFIKTIDATNPTQTNYTLVIEGDVTNSLITAKVGQTGTENDGTTVTDKTERTNRTIGFADMVESKNIYLAYYKTYKQFRDMADKLGFASPQNLKHSHNNKQFNDNYAFAFARIMQNLNK